jgi:hypothetical protein
MQPLVAPSPGNVLSPLGLSSLLAWHRPGTGLVPAAAAQLQLAALGRGGRGRRRGEGVVKTRGMGSQAGVVVGSAGVGCQWHWRAGGVGWGGGGTKRVFWRCAAITNTKNARVLLKPLAIGLCLCTIILAYDGLYCSSTGIAGA